MLGIGICWLGKYCWDRDWSSCTCDKMPESWSDRFIICGFVASCWYCHDCLGVKAWYRIELSSEPNCPGLLLPIFLWSWDYSSVSSYYLNLEDTFVGLKLLTCFRSRTMLMREFCFSISTGSGLSTSFSIISPRLFLGSDGLNDGLLALILLSFSA